MLLHGNEKLEEEISNLFNLYIEETGETVPSNIQGVYMEDIAAVEDFVQAGNFIYDFDIDDRSMIGQPTTGSVGKHSNTVHFC